MKVRIYWPRHQIRQLTLHTGDSFRASTYMTSGMCFRAASNPAYILQG